jgi:superfamily II DNA or RNA helicase
MRVVRKTERKPQLEAIKAVFDSLEKGVKRQIISVCTGGGKTIISAKIASRFKKILFMAHTEELISQSGVAFLNEFYPEVSTDEIINQYGGIVEYARFIRDNPLFVSEEEKLRFGVIKADLFNIDAHITIASFQTIHRRLDKIPADQFDLVIIDECHLACSPTIVKTINHLSPKLLLGLTATPYRADGANLADVFDAITYQYGISDAIDDGYLCELDAIQIQTQLNLDDVRTTAGEFNQKDLKQEVDTPQRNNLIVSSYKKYAEGKQNLIFCVDVEHAQNLCEAFRNAGYPSEYIVGDVDLTPDRQAVLSRFRAGETRHLSNCMVLTAGYDNPYVGAITLACPTKSLTKFIQSVGRGTRTLPGVIDGLDTPQERRAAIKASAKPACIILDVVDMSSRHKIINTWSLDKDKPAEKKVFTTSEKKQKMIEARMKREMEAKVKEDKRVSLFELPKVKLSNSIKMKDAATEAQLNYLRGLGYDTENTTYTKGNANELISNDPAPIKWVHVIKKAGYDVSNGVTRAQAQLVFHKMSEEKKKVEESKAIGSGLIDGLE